MVCCHKHMQIQSPVKTQGETRENDVEWVPRSIKNKERRCRQYATISIIFFWERDWRIYECIHIWYAPMGIKDEVFPRNWQYWLLLEKNNESMGAVGEAGQAHRWLRTLFIFCIGQEVPILDNWSDMKKNAFLSSSWGEKNIRALLYYKMKNVRCPDDIVQRLNSVLLAKKSW